MQAFYPLPHNMTTAQFRPQQGWSLNSRAVPLPEDEEVLFRTLAWGLHGDRSQEGGFRTSIVSEVVAVGDAITVWGSGDVVVLDGNPSLLNLSPYFRLPESLEPLSHYRLTPPLSLEDACLLVPVTKAVRVLEALDIQQGERVVVLGLGLVEQITILLARHLYGAVVFAADPNPTLRRRGEYNGASRLIRLPEESISETVLQETRGEGADALVLGSLPSAFGTDAFAGLGQSGRAVFTGLMPGMVSFDASGFRELNHTLLPHKDPETRHFQRARKLLLSEDVERTNLGGVAMGLEELETLPSEPASWEHRIHLQINPPTSRQAQTQ
ncbi:MAG: hypothetical protein HKN21_08160 [Candidatus Eisenbacteria bacterium]|uniref:Zinc-binding alcohol dehydrogenase n=1 Tax=Eiseniibacteriota bacterium TaxID=2212470 RepID=A0A7Y2E7M4_UNCEI|nr:hypothetical protein [Candidatus Eisenbacteria bacterium]